MATMLDEDGPASGFDQNRKQRPIQPPLRLRHSERPGRPRGLLLESHPLYPFAASVFLEQPGPALTADRLADAERWGNCRDDLLLALASDARRSEFHRRLYDLLWEQWPTETRRGPSRDADRDEAAWFMHSAGGVTVDEIADRLSITPKAAGAKIRRGRSEFDRQLRDDRLASRGEGPPRGPWVVTETEMQCVYMANTAEVMFELEIDDPSSILPRPDLLLLEARKIADCNIPAGRLACRLDEPFNEADQLWNRALKRAFEELGGSVRFASADEIGGLERASQAQL